MLFSTVHYAISREKAISIFYIKYHQPNHHTIMIIFLYPQFSIAYIQYYWGRTLNFNLVSERRRESAESRYSRILRREKGRALFYEEALCKLMRVWIGYMKWSLSLNFRFSHYNYHCTL